MYIRVMNSLADAKTMLISRFRLAGFLAACPYLFKAILGPVGRITADMLIRYKICKVGTIRKIFYGAGNTYICISVSSKQSLRPVE